MRYFALLLLFTAGCAVTQDDRLTATATIFPLYDFAREIAGDRASVSMLLPPGTEAHTYEPRPSDIAMIQNSDIFIYSGAGLEPWVGDLLAGVSSESRIEVEASDSVLLRTGSDEHGVLEEDPHIWLDFENDMKIADAIAEAFADKDPANSEAYMANAERLKNRLLALDQSYKEGLRDCRTREFITGGHSAYGYLATRYNLSFESVYGLSPDSEPTPQTVRDIEKIMAEHGIDVMLVEDTISARIAESIAGETKAKIISINPGHTIAKDEFEGGKGFIQLMEENLQALKEALGCR